MIASPITAGILGAIAVKRPQSSCPAECRKLVAVSRRVMVAADQGLVFPVQKRLGPHDYVYLAVRAFGRLGSPLQPMQAPALAALAA